MLSSNERKGAAILDLLLAFILLLLFAGLALVLSTKPELVTQYFEPEGTPKPLYSNLSSTLANVSITITAAPLQAATPTTPLLTPTPAVPQGSACSPSNRCLATKPDFCLNGVIVQNCGQCGCPEGQECRPEGCIPKKFA